MRASCVTGGWDYPTGLANVLAIILYPNTSHKLGLPDQAARSVACQQIELSDISQRRVPVICASVGYGSLKLMQVLTFM